MNSVPADAISCFLWGKYKSISRLVYLSAKITVAPCHPSKRSTRKGGSLDTDREYLRVLATPPNADHYYTGVLLLPGCVNAYCDKNNLEILLLVPKHAGIPLLITKAESDRGHIY